MGVLQIAIGPKAPFCRATENTISICVTRAKEAFQPPQNDVMIIEMKPDNSHGYTESTAGQVFNIQLFTQIVPRISLSWKMLEHALIFDSIIDICAYVICSLSLALFCLLNNTSIPASF